MKRKERNDHIWQGDLCKEDGNTACFVLREMSEVNYL